MPCRFLLGRLQERPYYWLHDLRQHWRLKPDGGQLWLFQWFCTHFDEIRSGRRTETRNLYRCHESIAVTCASWIYPSLDAKLGDERRIDIPLQKGSVWGSRDRKCGERDKKNGLVMLHHASWKMVDRLRGTQKNGLASRREKFKRCDTVVLWRKKKKNRPRLGLMDVTVLLYRTIYS